MRNRNCTEQNFRARVPSLQDPLRWRKIPEGWAGTALLKIQREWKKSPTCESLTNQSLSSLAGDSKSGTEIFQYQDGDVIPQFLINTNLESDVTFNADSWTSV